jgi:imidazolonepropionase-like amidohydrolase
MTIHAAWTLGIDHRTGSLEVGKDADVVLWNRTPFSVYAAAEKVWIDGELALDREKRGAPWSDFELGQEGSRPSRGGASP